MKALIPSIATCLLILNSLGGLQAQVVEEGEQAAPSRKAVKKKKEPRPLVASYIDHPVHLFILSGQSNMAGDEPRDRVHDGGCEALWRESGRLHQSGQGRPAHLSVVG